jgi:D-alanyl-lipoteichoic acid acyltransferase DltB (MBOAT superfamily)
MLFNSLQFILFFIAITILFFKLPHRFRWGLLLASSCYFYMAFKPSYILILAFTIVVDYFAGLLIENATRAKRKLFLVCSLIANIGVLSVFKYWNFLVENLTASLSLFSLSNPIPLLMIVFPIGLSFHTFQAMSYTIEVYRGHQKAEKHFGIYALYVMFYPQLVAGPIERPQNLLPQIHAEHNWDFERVKSGLMLMVFGMFKKVVIADRLAIVVTDAYGDVYNQNGLTLLIATVFFAFQAYCDFSGYSDIAIGSARVMGFKLMENFRTPFFSKSIAEFWKCWHISLSSWFRDYLYISLGGNRVGVPRMYFNLFFVFLISGLWHGAKWTFVIWGALHGVYLIIGMVKDKLLPNLKLPAVLQIIVTFSLFTFSLIFFRANNLTEALCIIRKTFTLSLQDSLQVSLNANEMFFSVFLIIFLMVKERFVLVIPTQNTTRFYFLFVFILICTYLFGIFKLNQFIYFQF